MQVWMHKQTGDLILVHPQWEPLQITIDEKFYHELGDEVKKMLDGRKVVHGVLYQAGWLAQNQHGVWAGLPMNVDTCFEDLGEL